jgi:hypothetical protein
MLFDFGRVAGASGVVVERVVAAGGIVAASGISDERVGATGRILASSVVGELAARG